MDLSGQKFFMTSLQPNVAIWNEVQSRIASQDGITQVTNKACYGKTSNKNKRKTTALSLC